MVSETWSPSCRGRRTWVYFLGLPLPILEHLPTPFGNQRHKLGILLLIVAIRPQAANVGGGAAHAINDRTVGVVGVFLDGRRCASRRDECEDIEGSFGDRIGDLRLGSTNKSKGGGIDGDTAIHGGQLLLGIARI